MHVIQRTVDGIAGRARRIAAKGASHTRIVDASCDGEGKCVRQVVGEKPSNVGFLITGVLAQAAPSRRDANHRAFFQELRSIPNGVPSGRRSGAPCAVTPETSFS